jgi:hypothetical protein
MRSILNKIKKVVSRGEVEADVALAERGPEDEQARQKAEAAAMLRDFVEANLAILEHDPGPLPQFEAPVRLRPVMPLPGQEVSGSWIGGLPMLPEAMPWPILADKPALFLAQIDCTELPQGIWGGMGPRDGWLVFFVAQDHRVSEVCVRHVDGPLAEREPPEPLVYPSSTYASAALVEWIRPELGTVPRWPVVVEPIDDLPQERGVARKMDLQDAPRRKLHADLRMRDELMPFDWASALLLLYAADEDLEHWAGVHGDRIAKAQADGETETVEELTGLQAGVQAARDKLAQLIAGAEDASERVRFSDKAGALIVEGLRRIRYPVEIYRDGGKTIQQAMASGSSAVMRNYIALSEMRARELYCADPALLPPLQRAHFEGIWTSDARYEHGHMGGRPGDPFRNIMITDPAVLLILPTSDLIGWMWGDMDDLCITIPPDALQAGDWDQAEGAVSNG